MSKDKKSLCSCIDGAVGTQVSSHSLLFSFFLHFFLIAFEQFIFTASNEELNKVKMKGLF